jgi:glucose dehydrogenase
MFAALLPLTQAQTPNSDWPMYNRDLAGTRYSPLTQINASNVGRLTRAGSRRRPRARACCSTATASSDPRRDSSGAKAIRARATSPVRVSTRGRARNRRGAAVNAKTGDFAWKVPLGVTDELPEGKRNTGRLNMGGPMATAGGLVFIGASNDRRFRAFDSRTGKPLWETKLDYSAHAVPITFMGKYGTQYVAIVAAGASALDDPGPPGKDALLVFALP